jgi:hypothetical protein
VEGDSSANRLRIMALRSGLFAVSLLAGKSVFSEVGRSPP